MPPHCTVHITYQSFWLLGSRLAKMKRHKNTVVVSRQDPIKKLTNETMTLSCLRWVFFQLKLCVSHLVLSLQTVIQIIITQLICVDKNHGISIIWITITLTTFICIHFLKEITYLMWHGIIIHIPYGQQCQCIALKMLYYLCCSIHNHKALFIKNVIEIM